MSKLGEEGPLLVEGVKKIGPGDIVQIKGNVGPKMTVIGGDPELANHLECVYWDTSRTECNRFESVYVHRDSLTLFPDATPLIKRAPVTVSRSTLETAIRNGRHMLSQGSQSHDTMLSCFCVIADELIQHVDIEGGNC